MQPRIKVIFTYFTIAIVVIMLLFGLKASTTERECTEGACCKKTEEACAEQGKAPADDLMMENLSRQFIIVSPIN